MPSQIRRGASETLHVVGAGPSGLAAAIAAAKAGLRVVVSERHPTVGGRFHGDFQGLENWSVAADALEELRALGIEPTFEAHPISAQVCYGPDGREHRFRSDRPFYYLIRRGSGPGTLDRALEEQAASAGVEIRYGETVRRPEGRALRASGPKRADVLTVGLLFETDLPDGLGYAGLGESFAPGGYAYLLAHGGEATLAICVFERFERRFELLDRTLDSFRRRLSFGMRGARRFGGVGNVFYRPPRAEGDGTPIGEAAGTQDALWGFGNRFALVSGALAGRFAGQEASAHGGAWDERIGCLLRSSHVNRFLFDRLGDRAYRWLLWRLGRARDPWTVLHRIYRPSPWRAALFPLVRALGRRAPAELPEPADETGAWQAGSGGLDGAEWSGLGDR